MKTVHIAIALCATFAAHTAGAASFQVSQQNASNIFGSEPEAYSRTVSTNVGTFGAGLFRLVADDLFDGVGGVLQNFDAFCIDLFNTIALPADYTTAPNYFAAATVDRIDALFTNAPVSGIDSDTKAAATQVALWEIITDNVLDLSADGFQLTGTNNADTVALANSFLTNITNGSWTGSGASFTFLDVTGSQDVIAFGVQPVPLPASVWLLGAGVAGLGALRRKRACASQNQVA